MRNALFKVKEAIEMMFLSGYILGACTLFWIYVILENMKKR